MQHYTYTTLFFDVWTLLLHKTVTMGSKSCNEDNIIYHSQLLLNCQHVRLDRRPLAISWSATPTPQPRFIFFPPCTINNFTLLIFQAFGSVIMWYWAKGFVLKNALFNSIVAHFLYGPLSFQEKSIEDFLSLMCSSDFCEYIEILKPTIIAWCVPFTRLSAHLHTARMYTELSEKWHTACFCIFFFRSIYWTSLVC